MEGIANDSRTKTTENSYGERSGDEANIGHHTELSGYSLFQPKGKPN
jgi:hypothetical protein